MLSTNIKNYYAFKYGNDSNITQYTNIYDIYCNNLNLLLDFIPKYFF